MQTVEDRALAKTFPFFKGRGLCRIDADSDLERLLADYDAKARHFAENVANFLNNIGAQACSHQGGADGSHMVSGKIFFFESEPPKGWYVPDECAKHFVPGSTDLLKDTGKFSLPRFDSFFFDNFNHPAMANDAPLTVRQVKEFRFARVGGAWYGSLPLDAYGRVPLLPRAMMRGMTPDEVNLLAASVSSDDANDLRALAARARPLPQPVERSGVFRASDAARDFAHAWFQRRQDTRFFGLAGAARRRLGGLTAG